MKRLGQNEGKGQYTEYRKSTNNYCLYCGKIANTKDHLPSQCLLDKPYPNNIKVIPACFDCNNGYSRYENYFTSFIEEVRFLLADTVFSIEEINNFNHNLHLVNSNQDKSYDYLIKCILTKLGKGHVGFVLDYLTFSSSVFIDYDFRFNLTQREIDLFNGFPVISDIAEEIGSRAKDLVSISLDNLVGIYYWDVIQVSKYRYTVYREKEEVFVKIVLIELLFTTIKFKN